jgi:hypothetical protein
MPCVVAAKVTDLLLALRIEPVQLCHLCRNLCGRAAPSHASLPSCSLFVSVCKQALMGEVAVSNCEGDANVVYERVAVISRCHVSK